MEKRKVGKSFKSQIALLLVITMMVTLVPSWNIKAEASQDNGKAKTTEVTLQNPKIVKDDSMEESGQKVTWDCVWFGSYPQSEVTSSDAMYSELKSATGWNSNNDITISGVKYRRMKKGDATCVGEKEDGDYYWSDATTYHYFKYESIKWRVLNVSSNGQALLLADKGLDNQKYNSKWEDITWEKSTIRSWLNGYSSDINTDSIDYSDKNFIDSAFSSTAQNAIAQSTVINDDNSEYEIEGGNNTSDKVFLLSESEVYKTDKAKSYGFTPDYGTNDEARRSKCSTYAYAMGTWRGNLTTYKGNCYWWLRSPGCYTFSAACVLNNGYVYRSGWLVNSLSNAVRPALYLNLTSSNLYTYGGTVCSDGTMNEQGGGSNGSGTEGEEKATPSLQFASSSVTKIYGDAAFTNKLTKQTDGKITYKSSDNSIATVDTTGKVTIKKAGTVTITATASTGTNYTSGSKSYKLIINRASSKITASSYTKTYGDKSFTLSAKTNGNGKLSYKSDNSNIAKIDGTTGKVTLKGYGKATITITAAQTSQYSKATKKVTVTVKPKKMSTPSVKLPSKGTIQVSWNKDSKASGYQIRYSTKSSMSGAKVVTVKGASTSTKKISGLSKGKKYYVQVRAYKSSYYGTWSNTKSEITKK